MWEQASCPLQYNTVHGSPRGPAFDLINLTSPGHRNGAYDHDYAPSGDVGLAIQWQTHGQGDHLPRTQTLQHDATGSPRILEVEGPSVDRGCSVLSPPAAGTRDPQGDQLLQAPPEHALLQTTGISLPRSPMQRKSHGRASSYRSAAGLLPGGAGVGGTSSVSLPATVYSAVVPVQASSGNDNVHHLWPAQAATGRARMPEPPCASTGSLPHAPGTSAAQHAAIAIATHMTSESELDKLLKTADALGTCAELERPAFDTAHAVNMACHAISSPAPLVHPMSRLMATTAAAAIGSSSGVHSQQCHANPVQMETGHGGRPSCEPRAHLDGKLKVHDVHGADCGGQQGEQHVDKPRQPDIDPVPFLPPHQQYHHGVSHNNVDEQACDVDCSPVNVSTHAEVTPVEKAETLHEQLHENVIRECSSREILAPIPVQVRQSSCEPITHVRPWIKGEKRVRDVELTSA